MLQPRWWQMRASIRLLTAIALIAISGFSVAQGWRIVRFSLATMNIDPRKSEQRLSTLGGLHQALPRKPCKLA